MSLLILLLKKYPVASGLVLMTLITMLHFTYFHGSYFGFDDLEYCRLAFNLFNGTFKHDSLYAFRYGAILPLAVSYFLFGVNDFANMVYGYAVLLSILVITIRMMPDVSLPVKLLTALLLTVTPMHLMYVEKPMPDLITSLGFIMCFYSYFSLRFPNVNPVSSTMSVSMFVAGAIVIFLSKETFLIIYPFFAVLLLTDILKKRFTSYWKSIIIWLVLFLGIYFLSYQIFMGDPFARIHALFTNRYISECTYELQPLSVVLRRILYSLWLEFLRNGFLLTGIFLVLMFTSGKQDYPFRFIGWSWISLLLLSNFMTISYTHYVPLCDDPRHFLFILPVGIMLMGYGFKFIEEISLKSWTYIVLFLSVQLILSVILHFEHSWYVYMPLIAGWSVFYLKRKKSIIYVSFVIGIFSYFVTNAKYNLGVNHNGQKALIKAVIQQDDEDITIYTDHGNANLTAFYTKYDTTRYTIIAFRDAGNLEPDTLRKQYIIINGMTLYLSNSSWESLPDPVKTAHEQLPVFYENKAGVVYKLQ